MNKEKLKQELYHYIATQCTAISINMEHRLVYHYDQMEKVGEFIYNLEEKRIEELENQIADIKANCDLAIEGRDIKIKELKKENRLLGERCNQLLKDKGNLIDQIEKMRNCGNCNGIIRGGIRTEKCKICMRSKDLSQWELQNDRI